MSILTANKQYRTSETYVCTLHYKQSPCTKYKSPDSTCESFPMAHTISTGCYADAPIALTAKKYVPNKGYALIKQMRLTTSRYSIRMYKSVYVLNSLHLVYNSTNCQLQLVRKSTERTEPPYVCMYIRTHVYAYNSTVEKVPEDNLYYVRMLQLEIDLRKYICTVGIHHTDWQKLYENYSGISTHTVQIWFLFEYVAQVSLWWYSVFSCTK